MTLSPVTLEATRLLLYVMNVMIGLDFVIVLQNSLFHWTKKSLTTDTLLLSSMGKFPVIIYSR